VNAIWVVVGLGLVGGIVALISMWQRGEQGADMGAVSNQWISEHRLGHGQNNDSRR
jgi:hypothetical protein